MRWNAVDTCACARDEDRSDRRLVERSVAAGVAQSLAAPGGNVTGLASLQGAEYYPKPLELIRAAVPGLSRMGIFWPGNYRIPEQIATWGKFARAQGLAFEERPVSTFRDFVAGFDQLRGQPAGAALLLNFGGSVGDWKSIVKAALRRGIPTISPYIWHTEAGGLMSYSLDHGNEMERRAALVDKILRGGDPARIPFELPTRTLLAVNVGTARLLGLALPAELLVRADRVFE
jgi:putative ABC transport system substrate-binding protein